MSTRNQRKTVAIAGGGLAGLAAGCALSDAGFDVTVYERRPYLGGRASSYEHPGTAEVVDNCQHVLLGCCTSLIDLYRRIGVEDQIRWYDRLTFLEPGGRRSEIGPSALPAPMHAAPSFLRVPMLSLKEKMAITRAMLALVPRLPEDDGSNFLEWLRRHGQSERAVDRFWKTVLVSALNEDLDRVSVSNAALVFRESFLKSAAAGRMGVPVVPLSDLYSRAGDYITGHGGHIELRASVEAVQPSISSECGAGGKTNLNATGPANSDSCVRLCVGGSELCYNFAVLALPFNTLERVLPDESLSLPLRRALNQFGTSPITGVHLWFDRKITELDHAVLLDRTIQWMFHKSQIQSQTPVSESFGTHTERREGTTPGEADRGSYVELVISASKTLLSKPRAETIELALKELAEFFPAVRHAQVLKSTVIKEVHATFSPSPGSDAYRPGPETHWSRLFLAGDWTATGWPATMESAVRSGYLAAEAVCRAAGIERRFLVPDLAAAGLMKLFP
ncbi:MAG TPA: hydroxysqualene dehydroxylase HpnE [Terriglobales bacterium]|nr:hydroxysqualene dehydroxylase HpnE [Terriglobales bacterium]